MLPGIGPTMAANIIAHREANGPFTTIEAIMDVPGIGEGKFAAMKDLITVGP
jgi:competence protein ComEA